MMDKGQMQPYVSSGPFTFDSAKNRTLHGIGQMQQLVNKYLPDNLQSQLTQTLDKLVQQIGQLNTTQLNQQDWAAAANDLNHATENVRQALASANIGSDTLKPYSDAPIKALSQLSEKQVFLDHTFRDVSETAQRGLSFVLEGMKTYMTALYKNPELIQVLEAKMPTVNYQALVRSFGTASSKVLSVTPLIGVVADAVSLEKYSQVAKQHAQPLVDKGMLTPEAAQAYGPAYAKASLLQSATSHMSPTAGGNFISGWAQEYHVSPEALRQLGHPFLADQVQQQQSFAPDV